MAKTQDSPASTSPETSSQRGNGTQIAGSSDTSFSARDSQDARTAESQDASGNQQKHTLSKRKSQFLIAARRSPGLQAMGLQPLQFNLIEQTLRSSPDIEIVDTVGPKNIVGALADGMSDVPSVLVAKMTDQKAAVLHQQAQGRLIVERDQSLTMADASFQQPGMVACSTPTSGTSFNASFIIVGKDNQPLAGAEVYLFGSMIPANGVSDARGKVDLSMFGETPQSIRALYVKPKADYWSFYQQEPEISTDEPNVVGLKPLSDWPGLKNFPQQMAYGWGQKAMRLDQLPDNYRGQGVRIAIIDSGAATTHDDLKSIHFGFDIINKKTNPNSWNEDTISHGSHCAGVIAGNSDNATGIRGFAPDAEIHVCKLFPGGQVSQLIDALEYCIEKQVDVVNLSLGGAEASEALEQQILRAKRAGIACIVAAGNSGGMVQYPASSPHVLAVAAIGKLNEFPDDSYHTQTLSQRIDANGFFSPKFTCYGPQIGVCGPGVAITSSVPANNFAVWDGTSMAAPHITGLAALVLAHHPDFQAMFRTRSPERVERLFQVIKASARPINLGDPTRTGFGLPDVLVAVGLQSQMGMPMGFAPRALQPGQMQPMGGVTNSSQFTSAASTSNEAFAPASLNPMAMAYAEQARAAQAQMSQQPTWFSNPWSQFGQSAMAGSMQQATMGNAFDPFASYQPAFFTGNQTGLPFRFGIGQQSFGRQGW